MKADIYKTYYIDDNNYTWEKLHEFFEDDFKKIDLMIWKNNDVG